MSKFPCLCALIALAVLSQAANAECGGSYDKLDYQLPNTWFETRTQTVLQFREICKMHHACYTEYGSKRAECEETYQAALYELCDARFTKHTAPHSACRRRANVSLRFVAKEGGNFYRQSQRQAKRVVEAQKRREDRAARRQEFEERAAKRAKKRREAYLKAQPKAASQ